MPMAMNLCVANVACFAGCVESRAVSIQSKKLALLNTEALAMSFAQAKVSTTDNSNPSLYAVLCVLQG